MTKTKMPLARTKKQKLPTDKILADIQGIVFKCTESAQYFANQVKKKFGSGELFDIVSRFAKLVELGVPKQDKLWSGVYNPQTSEQAAQHEKAQNAIKQVVQRRQAAQFDVAVNDDTSQLKRVWSHQGKPLDEDTISQLDDIMYDALLQNNMTLGEEGLVYLTDNNDYKIDHSKPKERANPDDVRKVFSDKNGYFQKQFREADFELKVVSQDYPPDQPSSKAGTSR